MSTKQGAVTAAMTDIPPAPPSLADVPEAIKEMVARNRAAPPAPPTRDAAGARAELDRLYGNQNFLERFAAGDRDARYHFEKLTQQISGYEGPERDYTWKPHDPTPVDTTRGGKDLGAQGTVKELTKLADMGARSDVIDYVLKGGTMTREQLAEVQALRQARHGDAEWRKRLFDGDHEAGREQLMFSIAKASEIR
jgi:hypothetical protein